jgi:hypothetical protein
MGDEVFPGRKRLVALTGLSQWQVKQATATLVKQGLVRRRQPRFSSGKTGSNRYNLDPLWITLADIESTGGGPPTPVSGLVTERPAGVAPQPPDRGWSANATGGGPPTTEVDKEETDQAPFKERPIGPPLQAATPAIDPVRGGEAKDRPPENPIHNGAALVAAVTDDGNDSNEESDPAEYDDQWLQVKRAIAEARGAVA